jgi:hypothetical protein
LVSEQYLAGFFDGEGTFYIGKQFKNGKEYPKATVMLSQSGYEGMLLLEEIQKQYGGSLYQHLKAGEHKATKDAYKLWWPKDEAIELCQKLIPHLKLKQQAAQTVLAYLTRNQ